MNQVAFDLRAPYRPDGSQPLAGGTVGLPDGTLVDIAAELEQGDGVIVTDDPRVAQALSEVPVLKSTSVPEPTSKQTSGASASTKQGAKPSDRKEG
jgi:hypothetical protein